MLWHHESQFGTKFTLSSTLVKNVPERVRLLRDFTLKIFPVMEEDAGFYACSIVNRWPHRILHHLQVSGEFFALIWNLCTRLVKCQPQHSAANGVDYGKDS